jgi:hypothetical protein
MQGQQRPSDPINSLLGVIEMKELKKSLLCRRGIEGPTILYLVFLVEMLNDDLRLDIFLLISLCQGYFHCALLYFNI